MAFRGTEADPRPQRARLPRLSGDASGNPRGCRCAVSQGLHASSGRRRGLRTSLRLGPPARIRRRPSSMAGSGAALRPPRGIRANPPGAGPGAALAAALPHVRAPVAARRDSKAGVAGGECRRSEKHRTLSRRANRGRSAAATGPHPDGAETARKPTTTSMGCTAIPGPAPRLAQSAVDSPGVAPAGRRAAGSKFSPAAGAASDHCRQAHDIAACGLRRPGRAVSRRTRSIDDARSQRRAAERLWNRSVRTRGYAASLTSCPQACPDAWG